MVAYIALIVAVGGGVAWAGATIGSGDIRDDAVRARHIQNGEVTGADVADSSIVGANVLQDALTGADVSEASLFNDNSLNGADINEGTLSKVPSAGAANLAANTQLLQSRNAAAYVRDTDGFDSSLRPTSVSVNEGATPALIGLGELLLKIECNAGPDLEALALTGASGDTLINATTRSATDDRVQNTQDVVFRSGEEFDLMPDAATEHDDSATGSFAYYNPARPAIVAGHYLAEETPTRCIFVGSAVESDGS